MILNACQIFSTALFEPQLPLTPTAYNFSHRIDHLSFGEEIPGIINPLDGTEKITYNSKRSFSSFLLN